MKFHLEVFIKGRKFLLTEHNTGLLLASLLNITT